MTFIKTVNENPIAVNFLKRLEVLSLRSSQKSCAEKCTSKEVAHMDTNIRRDGDKALFPIRPKDGRDKAGMEFKNVLPAAI
jgi:hypothetical protein